MYTWDDLYIGCIVHDDSGWCVVDEIDAEHNKIWGVWSDNEGTRLNTRLEEIILIENNNKTVKLFLSLD